MAADGGGPVHTAWTELIIREWALVLAIVGHFMRTEVSRALLRRDIDALEKRQGEDRETTNSMLSEIRADVKRLLERQP